MPRIFFLLMIVALAACAQFPHGTAVATADLTQAETPVEVAQITPRSLEQPLILLPISGPLSTAQAEISGLTWHGDDLVILPQYPGRFADPASPGYLFSLPKSAILAYLDGRIIDLPAPHPIPFDSQGLENILPGFEGFEAIGFQDERVYLTIEAKPGLSMSGYLVTGSVEPSQGAIYLDPQSQVEIPAQARLSNMSDEALVLFEDTLFTFYEANGANVNPEPIVHRFSLSGQPKAPVTLPNLEYRLTDASQPDITGHFWVINTFYPGDLKLKPAPDTFSAVYGEGASHARSNVVERLVALKIGSEGITFPNTAPIQFELLNDGEARNWEGLAQLDERGFLLVTDKYPKTLLAFVSRP